MNEEKIKEIWEVYDRFMQGPFVVTGLIASKLTQAYFANQAQQPDGIHIARTSNGCSMSGEFGSEAFEFDENNLQRLQDMFYVLADIMAPSSRHSQQRIKVQIVHGDKYVCLDKKNCPICQQE